MKTAIVILAAGSSLRMGEPKQLLPFGKTTLLGNFVEIAQQTSRENVFCVLGANYKAIKSSIKKYDCSIIFNPNFANGLSSSIVCAVKELQEFDYILFTLADQPKITSDFLSELLVLSKENPSKIIATNYFNKFNGVPIVFPKHFYNNLLQLKGDIGARKILISLDKYVLVKESTVNLIDIDTKEDFKKLITNS